MRGSALRQPLARHAARATGPSWRLNSNSNSSTSTSTSAARSFVCRQCVAAGRRYIQISAAPATEYPTSARSDAFGSGSFRDESDAKFQVLGSPHSLLSVSLSASQNLYTRRGTLVSVAGKVENATSTLTLLAPVRRALLGIPFLYQRVTSTTPVTLLVATKAANTTLFSLRLDGTTDWVVAQRNALLAWTGHTLTVTPQRSPGSGRLGLGLGLAHWGSSFVTGRGLVALAAPGYIYPVTVAAGEELAVHPSHVVAYASTKHAPQPFRFRSAGMAQGAVASAVEKVAGAVSSTAATTANITSKAVRLTLQTPAVSSSASASASEPAAAEKSTVAQLVANVRASSAYQWLARAAFDARTVLRRTVWGDRLFVHVRGPATLLMSSRGVRVADVLTRDDVNEIADAEAGSVAQAVAKAAATTPDATDATDVTDTPTIHVATTMADGKVELAETKDLKEFVR